VDPDFWKQRWQEGQIGFHQVEVNPRLVEYWPTLGLPSGGTVLVPLCGKSLDMWWLHERGHPVTGVELSPIAVRDFFAAAQVEPAMSRTDRFEISEAKGVRILQGDVFLLRAEDLRNVAAVYDRAALIALPPNVRLAYARALAEKLPQRVRMLLICLESDKAGLGGPPFSVDEKEVRDLYEPAFRVEVVHRSAFEEAPPHLRARGHDKIADVVYTIARDAHS
jgi:thiopurine S-methyltransferase